MGIVGIVCCTGHGSAEVAGRASAGQLPSQGARRAGGRAGGRGAASVFALPTPRRLGMSGTCGCPS